MRHQPLDSELHRLQRHRWVRYVAVESLLGILVGYYALPQLVWFSGIVALLSWSVGMQLAIFRQQRKTWQSQQLRLLLDAIERIAGGIALVLLSLHGVWSDVPREVVAGVGVWSAFFLIAGTAAGEYWWQFRRFRRMEYSAQLRYLCNCMRHRRTA
ncbi:MAG: hypothetical protein KatS3mg038_0711 [Candidatus Kapaibacterium sp.]|nr:MAG: hypothetical protein KatS3mg038_0711 [Candidatus Kapabacteria bacterium]